MASRLAVMDNNIEYSECGRASLEWGN